jgi:hypothetical protein
MAQKMHFSKVKKSKPEVLTARVPLRSTRKTQPRTAVERYYK